MNILRRIQRRKTKRIERYPATYADMVAGEPIERGKFIERRYNDERDHLVFLAQHHPRHWWLILAARLGLYFFPVIVGIAQNDAETGEKVITMTSGVIKLSTSSGPYVIGSDKP